jgi:Fe-S-cluster containining protein
MPNPSDNLSQKALSRKRDFKLTAQKVRKMKPKESDALFQKLHEEAFDHINCLECANCCKGLGPRLLDRDMDRLASALKMKISSFIDQYTRQDEDGDRVFKSMPCPFLMPDNYCMVYESRPKACREYPHTDQKNIRSILSLCVKNTETCPVVYEIFEKIAIS